MSENLIAKKINQERLVEVASKEFYIEVMLKNEEAPLALTAEAKIVSIEAYQGEAKVFGNVTFKFLYPGAEEGIIETVDFNESILNEAFSGGSKLKAEICVKEIEISKDKASATVKVIILEVKNEEIDIAEENAEILQKSETVYLPNLVKECNGVAEIFFEEKIDEMGALLSDSAEVILTGTKITDGILTVDGMLCLSVVYMSGGYPCTKFFKQSFSEELCSNIVAADTEVAVQMNVKGCRLNYAEGLLKVETTVAIEALIFLETEHKLPVACFSTRYEVKAEEAQLNLRRFRTIIFFDEKLSHNEQIPNVKTLLASLYPRNIVLGHEIIGENMSVNGIVKATLIYLDTESKIKSSIVEFPYNVSVRVPKGTSSAIVYGIVTGFDAKLKRDGTVEIFADLRFAARLFSDGYIRILSEMAIIAEKEDDLPAISLYIVNEGDAMWDVMCALSSSEANIVEQNPDIFENGREISVGDRVIVFRP